MLLVECVDGLRERFVRSVSWTPGAEGAEGLRADFWDAWLAAGTIRRDCDCLSVGVGFLAEADVSSVSYHCGGSQGEQLIRH